MNRDVKYSKAKDLYLTDLRISSKSASTNSGYTQVLEQFGEYLRRSGDCADEEISPADIIGWKHDLSTRGVGNNTICHYLTILRVFFKWCVSNDIYATQPINDTAFPFREEIVHDILTQEEIQTLLDDRKTNNSHRYIIGCTPNSLRDRAIIRLLITSGIRVSEMINLRLKDVDFEKALLYVEHGKGDKSRYAPLPEKASGVLLVYINDRERRRGKMLLPDDWLFVCTNMQTRMERRMTRQAVSNMVEDYVYKVTWHKGITAHDLRHAAASLWDDMGIPIRDVQKALGHANVSTTEHIYVSIINKDKAATSISERMNDLYRATHG